MDQYTLFVLLSPFGCAITVLTALFGWQQRRVHSARPLAFSMMAVAAYLVMNTLELVDPTPQGTLFFAQMSYVCISVMTIYWLSFALVYTNRQSWLDHPAFRLFWIIPAITVALVFTNPAHHLIWKEYSFLPVGKGFLYMKVQAYGGFFWVFWMQAYLLILTSAFLIFWNNLSPRRQYRRQAQMAVIAALLPLTVNLVYVLHLMPGLQKDFSPLGYAFSGILLAVSIFRYRMLDLTPFARSILIDSMNDGMLTLDDNQRVADYNPAAARILTNSSIPLPRLGERYPPLAPYLAEMEASPGIELWKSELVVRRNDEDHYYDLQIRRLHQQGNQAPLGFLVLMHGITEHKKLLQAAHKLAEEDALTGVLNRSRFVELATCEIERGRNNPLHFSVMMIDVDHFKEVNDTYGHVCGDQLLRAFAQRLRALLRSTDLVGRIGGDEFTVLLPDTNLTQGYLLAERLCQQVATVPMQTADYGEFTVTISIGVSEYVQNTAQAGSTQVLQPVIINADRGLYQAKEQGRNRVCVHQAVGM